VRYREIILHKTESGRFPVQQFISAIRSRVDRAKIAQGFEAIETMQTVSALYLKKLSGRHDLWEIRIRRYRFLGFYAGQQLVLVHAFAKQTQKTPLHEIEVAVRRRQNYFGQRDLPL
jgi:phage-related protein